MIAFGNTPCTPTEFRTTMIMGAMARIGMVCDAMAHGMTLRSMTREWTMPMARATPASEPMRKPSSVGASVIEAWWIRLRLEVGFTPTVVFHNSATT